MSPKDINRRWEIVFIIKVNQNFGNILNRLILHFFPFLQHYDIYNFDFIFTISIVFTSRSFLPFVRKMSLIIIWITYYPLVILPIILLNLLLFLFELIVLFCVFYSWSHNWSFIWLWTQSTGLNYQSYKQNS